MQKFKFQAIKRATKERMKKKEKKNENKRKLLALLYFRL